MTASYQGITLDTGGIDDQAVLVLREGRLTAVLSRLGAMHDDLVGKWSVEALFVAPPPWPRNIFADPDEFVAWLDGEDLR